MLIRSLLLSAFAFACMSECAPGLCVFGSKGLAASFKTQTDARNQRAAAPAPTPAPEADDAVERVEVDLTGLLFTAIDGRGRFVTTLREEDVRVTEDGEPQELKIFQRETDAPIAIALAVDASASQEKVMEDEKRTARAFLDSVLRPEKDAAAIFSFTGVIRLEQPPTSDAQKLREAIDRLKVVYTTRSPECREENELVSAEDELRCKTALWDALWIAVSETLSKTPSGFRRAVVLLSDGDDTASRKEREETAEFAVRHNVAVYSIGIRDGDFPHGKLRRKELREISERTGGRAFFPASPFELSEAFAQIDRELRSQYFIAYTPTNRARDGKFREIEMEIRNPALRKEKLRLLYRRGYYARTDAP